MGLCGKQGVAPQASGFLTPVPLRLDFYVSFGVSTLLTGVFFLTELSATRFVYSSKNRRWRPRLAPVARTQKQKAVRNSTTAISLALCLTCERTNPSMWENGLLSSEFICTKNKGEKSKDETLNPEHVFQIICSIYC